jgi:Protein of unknown function (DUF3574)
MIRSRRVTALASFFLLSGCATAPQSICPSGEGGSINELLYFGTAKPHGVVTPAEWDEFLRTPITPRFPKGFTFWQASGQWQNSGGTITQETSFIVNLVHPDDDRSENAVRSITREYKSRFKQEAVLRVKDYACVSF